MKDAVNSHPNPVDLLVCRKTEPGQTMSAHVYTVEAVKEHPDSSEEPAPNKSTRLVLAYQTFMSNTWAKHGDLARKVFYALLVLGYAVYFGYAMHYEFGSEPSVRLCWVTCLIVFCVVIHLISKYFGGRLGVCGRFTSGHSRAISWIVLVLIYLAVAVFVVVDVVHVSKQPYNLVSGLGIIVYLILFFVFSHSPVHVNWRAVVWGLALQFSLALIILRWDRGYQAFSWLGDRIVEYLAHANAGSSFVFGDTYTDHFFAFKILPTIVFFSTTVSILFYLGWIQVLTQKIAVIMQYTMGTTAAESLNAAGNIFIGQTEAPLLIRPFLKDLTRSELHAVMTGGFATVSGSGLAIYTLFGAHPNHVLSASVMSAPAALAMSKLFYPETEVSKTRADDLKKIPQTAHRNIIEAASTGASLSVKVVANIAANLIAFISLLHFLNSALTWFGNRVGIEELTFELICSYVLFPFALVMGVELGDCGKVAKLIGIKTFLNEFVAYKELGVYISNGVALDEHVTNNGTWYYENDDIFLVETGVTLEDGVLSDRSEVISTYALCGFANFGSIGVMLGALGSMAPNQTAALASVAIRAMIAGNVACFMTACIAGLFYQG